VSVSIVQFLAPTDCGAKRTCTITDCAVVRLYDPLPAVISKSGQLSLTEPVKVPPPVFVMLNDCVEELWPTVISPKLRGVVWLTSQTGACGSPVPMQETSTLHGVPVSIVHVLTPVDWGVKRTSTVTDSPAARLYDPLPDVISKSE
jgi:hypothetical protein